MKTDNTFFQRKRNGHLRNTRNTNLLPHIFIVLAIANTCLYPRKTEFEGGILFSACPSFYNSVILSVGHSINI